MEEKERVKKGGKIRRRSWKREKRKGKKRRDGGRIEGIKINFEIYV